MSDVNKVELRRAAEAAPTGEWDFDRAAAERHFCAQVWDSEGKSLAVLAATEAGSCAARYIAAANPSVVLSLLDEHDALLAERDQLQRNLDFTEQWYAVRFERLADLGKSAGCWDAMAAIIANGTADQYEPPTYAQQLVLANHRADVAERERDQLRAEVQRLRSYEAEWEHVLNELRAELDAIRGQEPVAWKVIGVNPKHRHPHRSLEFSANLAEGQAAHWKSRGCTVEVIPLYALPPQQPDAVSVPRELLHRLLYSNNRNTFCAGTYLKAHDELSALLSTHQNEEMEPCTNSGSKS